MNTIKTCSIAAFAFVSAITVKAQTADEIIAKHVDALGGKDKLAQIKSVYIENTTEVMGNEAPTKVYVLNGKNYRMESDFGGQTMVQVVSDKSGWAINPFGGSPDPAAMTDDQFKQGVDNIYLADPLTNYAANGAKVELQGQDTVNNVKAYKIKYTNKFGTETTYYIDPTTYYFVQSVRQGNVMGQDVTVNTTYSNYQKTDFGLMMPYTVNVDMGQFALTINTKKVEVNKEIDPKIFDMPSK